MDGDISTRSSNACTAERENNCIELSVSPYGKGRTRNQSINLNKPAMCNYWLLSWNVIQSFSNYSYISTAVWHPMVRPLRILNMEEWVHYFWLKREESQPGKIFSNTILQQKVAAIPILLCKDKEKKVNIQGKVNTRGEQCEKHKRIRGKKWGKICQLNILHHLKKIWHLNQQ